MVHEAAFTKEDLWDLVIGGSILSTGGGGIGPDREQFDAVAEPVFASGATPRLLDAGGLTDDLTVYMRSGAGGGVTRTDRERYLVPGIETWWRDDIDPREWVRDRLGEMERLYPRGAWSPDPANWEAALMTRAAELHGAPDTYMPFEIGPNTFGQALSTATAGLPLVDADAAGHRAVPEASLLSFNVHNVSPEPIVYGSPWGDVIVVESVISWQRLEDISRHLAIASGRSVRGFIAMDGETVSRFACAASISKAIGIGVSVRAALDADQEVTPAILSATNGRLLFEGTIVARVNENRGAFIWGSVLLKGTGRSRGSSYKIWYKNENHMTWLDGEPDAMSPDIVTVVDPTTGYGLSNFDARAWDHGRSVVVIGIPSHPIWQTDRGLRIFHPSRWGFVSEYTPLDEIAER